MRESHPKKIKTESYRTNSPLVQQVILRGDGALRMAGYVSGKIGQIKQGVDMLKHQPYPSRGLCMPTVLQQDHTAKQIGKNHSSQNLRFRIGAFEEPSTSHISVSSIINQIEVSLVPESFDVPWNSPFGSSKTTLPDGGSLPDLQQNKGDPFPNCKVSPLGSPSLCATDSDRRSVMVKPRNGITGAVDSSPGCLGSAETKQQAAHSQLARELDCISQFELADMTAHQILEFSMRDKHTSRAFQRYLYTVWMKPVPSFTAVIIEHLDKLAGHKYGNYVLQVLSLRDLKIRNLVEDACRKNFLQWLGNEFSSRLLQQLLELSPPFQWFVSSQFALKFDLCKQDLPSLFVTVALIKSARDPGMLLFLDNYLHEKIQPALENRYMRRLMVFYCEKAPDRTLALIFQGILTLFTQEKILKERTLVSLLLGVMSRKHLPALDMLQRLVKQRPEQLVKDGFFRFLIKKCFIFPQSIPAISESISRGMQGYLRSKQAASPQPEFLREISLVCKFFGICLSSISVQTSKSEFKRVFLQATSRQTLNKYVSQDQIMAEKLAYTSNSVQQESCKIETPAKLKGAVPLNHPTLLLLCGISNSVGRTTKGTARLE